MGSRLPTGLYPAYRGLPYHEVAAILRRTGVSKLAVYMFNCPAQNNWHFRSRLQSHWKRGVSRRRMERGGVADQPGKTVPRGLLSKVRRQRGMLRVEYIQDW